MNLSGYIIRPLTENNRFLRSMTLGVRKLPTYLKAFVELLGVKSRCVRPGRIFEKMIDVYLSFRPFIAYKRTFILRTNGESNRFSSLFQNSFAKRVTGRTSVPLATGTAWVLGVYQAIWTNSAFRRTEWRITTTTTTG